MGTNAGFTPPAQPPCPYEPYMTRAQAVALRDAGALDPNCVVVITDGPVIGVPGNTSPTQIELNPVGPNDIGRTARVHTNFDNVAFAGLYNIDAGPDGTIEQLTDHWNNTCTDQEPGDAPSHTVHNQFPWGSSGPNLRDNTLNDCSLTDWDAAVAAGVLIWDNECMDAGIHLTGMGAGSTFIRNTIRGPQVTVSSPNVQFSANTLESAPVTFASTAAAAQTFQGNVIRGGTTVVNVANTVASTVNFTDCDISGGFRTTIADKPSGVVAFRRNSLVGANPSANPDVLISGTNVASFSGNTMRGGSMVSLMAGNTGSAVITDNNFLDGYVTEVQGTSTANVTIDGCVFTGHNTAAVDMSIDGSGTRSIADMTAWAPTTNVTQFVLPGAGAVTIGGGTELNSGRVIRDPATTANLTLSQVRGTGIITQGPGATGGALVLTASTLGVLGTVVTQNGPGSIITNSCHLAGGVVNTATATRGLNLTSCDLQSGTLTQARTGGTGTDSVQSLTLRTAQSLVTLNGAVDPGGSQTPVNFVTVEAGSQLTLTDPVGTSGVCLQNSHLTANAIVTGTGTGLVNGCRFSSANVNLGAFAHDRTIIDGNGPVTLTASNMNRLHNKAFSDVV